MVYALNSHGAALGSLGDEAGVELLRESLDRAKRADLHAAVARGAANLSYTLLSVYRPAEAIPVYDDGIAACVDHEMLFQLNCLRPGRAEAFFYLGEWDRAAEDLGAVLVDPYASVINRVIVLSHLGRLRARRGDPGAIEALDEALQLLATSDEAQLIVPDAPGPRRGGVVQRRPPGRRGARRSVDPVRAAPRLLVLPVTSPSWPVASGSTGRPPRGPTPPLALVLAGDAAASPTSGRRAATATRPPTRSSTATTWTTCAAPTTS